MPIGVNLDDFIGCPLPFAGIAAGSALRERMETL
jgi:hypothetical protein